MPGLMPDGSWKDHAHDDNRLNRFVRDLRRARLAADLSVELVCNRVEAEGHDAAFPNLVLWRERGKWDCLPVSTSAESLVYCAFRNSKGAPTPCRDYDPRCAPQPPMLASPEVVSAGIAAVAAAFEHFGVQMASERRP